MRTTWATVTGSSPLRVHLDGRTAPLDITPDTLVAGLAVGDRVLVLIQGHSLVVVGKAGSGAVDARTSDLLQWEIAAGTALGNPTHATVQAAADAAAANGRLLYAAGSYTTSSTLTIRGSADLSGLRITYNGSGRAVQVGDSTVRVGLIITTPHVIDGTKPSHGWSAGTEGIRLINLNSCKVTIPEITYFETGLTVYGQAQGNVHNSIHIGTLTNNKRNLVIDSDGTGWSNSNLYIGGRFSHLQEEGPNVPGTRQILIKETYHPADGNTFLNCSVEGATAEYHLDVEAGARVNQWINVRWEVVGGARVKWGPGARANRIIGGYGASLINVTRDATATRNNIEDVDRWDFSGGSGASAPVVQARNTGDATNPVFGLYDPGEYDPAMWAWSWSARELRGRGGADAHPRLKLTANTGRVYLGNGVTDPDMYLANAGGSLHLAGVITQTTAPPTGSAAALPATPTGYVRVYIDGDHRFIPYY